MLIVTVVDDLNVAVIFAIVADDDDLDVLFVLLLLMILLLLSYFCCCRCCCCCRSCGRRWPLLLLPFLFFVLGVATIIVVFARLIAVVTPPLSPLLSLCLVVAIRGKTGGRSGLRL